MKTWIAALGLIFTFSLNTFAQKIDYNTDGGAAAEGYDVVAYFSGKAVEGEKKYSHEYDGITYRFSSPANLDKFRQNPAHYAPQYGGWCAYAMGINGDKVSINPKTFEIWDGKLYLFYNAFFTNTLESWQKEGPEELRKKADANWPKAKYKN